MANSGSQTHTRTFLWCVPRSSSTALMKCLSFVDDLEAWFEPYLFAHVAARHYKRTTNSDLPREYHGHEDAYRIAAECLGREIRCELEPSRLSWVYWWTMQCKRMLTCIDIIIFIITSHNGRSNNATSVECPTHAPATIAPGVNRNVIARTNLTLTFFLTLTWT